MLGHTHRLNDLASEIRYVMSDNEQLLRDEGAYDELLRLAFLTDAQAASRTARRGVWCRFGHRTVHNIYSRLRARANQETPRPWQPRQYEKVCHQLSRCDAHMRALA